MEKLGKVIAGLEQCHRDIKYRDCDRCGYASAGSECERCLMEDALKSLKSLFADLVHANDEIIRLREAVKQAEVVIDRMLDERVDSEPVIHSQWEVVPGVITPGGDPLLRCPRCRSRVSEHLGGIECNRAHWSYCPNCGAKMDGEEDGN